MVRSRGVSGMPGDDEDKVIEFLERCENRPGTEEILDATGLPKD